MFPNHQKGKLHLGIPLPPHVYLSDRSGNAAAEREGNTLKSFKDVCLEHGSSQGQNLALTVLCVPNVLDSGTFQTCNRVAFGSKRIHPPFRHHSPRSLTPSTSQSR